MEKTQLACQLHLTANFARHQFDFLIFLAVRQDLLLTCQEQLLPNLSGGACLLLECRGASALSSDRVEMAYSLPLRRQARSQGASLSVGALHKGKQISILVRRRHYGDFFGRRSLCR